MILIFGYSDSGKSVERVQKEKNIPYKIYDDKVYKNDGRFLKKINKKTLVGVDIVILSPGVSIYNKKVRLMLSMGIKVVGEVEYASIYISTPIIAITGTNGKTTTTKMLTQVLSEKYKVEALGNVGNPLSTYIGRDDLDYIVAEVSSFQLESIDTFTPKISVMLNIDQDHLDRHKSMENYINAKLNIFRNNTKSSISILNIDDSIILKNIEHIEGKKYYISTTDTKAHVYMDEKYIRYRVGRARGKISIDSINISTNIYNIMAVILVSKLLKVDDEDIVDSINRFRIDKHKLETICDIDGVTYIDDSKSTNVYSTLNALRSTRSNNIILLLGGFDKKLDFGDIYTRYIDKIKYIITYGKSASRICKYAKKYKYRNILRCKKFDEAVLLSKSISKSGDVVLLSPACSSFDEFSGYIERGERFRYLVCRED